MEDHGVTADNIWNIDEKGFLIEIGSKMRRIMSREAYEQGRCRQSAQDGSREFITLLACVSALGKTIPPTLLYKGQSGDLQNSWVEELGDEDDVFFSATENGAYKNYYQASIDCRWPLNLRFIEWASKHGIIVLILPHMQHIGCNLSTLIAFNLWLQKNQVHLDKWLHKSLGQTRGFEKAGIWPFSPPIVLNAIARRPVTPPDAQGEPTKPPTPMTSKSIRRAQKTYKSNPTPENLDVIFRSQERLAAQHEVDKHMQSGLLEE
ncbi:hypothetical protein Egran_04498 [Elaphomyces granulatus]|uniref:DDE-1 domain-containing protein n=1 Tax=Elaphomyces granulatus TaxID=519963 RepID=A0A232LUN0_9EURO|nr:hypothetical protein Egran_04498 [Elaphomyces granulatus]